MKLRRSSKWIQASLVAVVAVFFTSNVYAQDSGLRIGVINVDKVLNESNLAKQSNAKLEKEFSKRQNDLRDIAQKIKVAAEKLDRDAAVMAEPERIRRQRELGDQDRELQRKQREYSEDLNMRNLEERSKLIEKTNIALKQIAEQRKFDLVIQDPVYATPKVDITDDIIKALNSLK
ncbi:MAG: OmpH family outer membrane protein [Betaproteobacteria bacterium]|jgi:outer membrane protein|uniref:OmpH family outer membrane protein n=1 Tax=Polynucleobacter sp. TaxID=2029855 RepID=UPI00334049C9|nr:OmpH family outer membrane protein [Betaproteobacteria bacterium]